MNPFKWLIDLIMALFGRSAPRPVDLPKETSVRGDPAWYKLARAEIGVSEIRGPEDEEDVLQYFADAGFPEVDSDSTAWCAAFTNAMIERAGYSGSKSLAAQSFLKWGKKVSKPYPGCIVVFWRGKRRSWQGHVGFYVSETSSHISVLGGNQSNEVSISDYPKSKLLGYRKPGTAMNSRTVKSAALGIASAGATGTAILDSQTQITAITDVLKSLGTSMPQLMLLTSALSIVAFMAIIWARVDDNREKGR